LVILWQDLLKTIVQDAGTKLLTKYGKKIGWKTLEQQDFFGVF
jgi:hypothetical protein